MNERGCCDGEIWTYDWECEDSITDTTISRRGHEH
jgi:hypothetical protein